MNKPLHILILEDNPIDAELIIRSLTKEGLSFEYIVVDNKNDFIDTLNNTCFDLILSDNSLPQFDATEAVQIVRKQLPDIPFILVTGTVHEDFIISIMKLGIDDYILKDRLTRLAAAIESAVQKKQAEKAKKEAEEKLRESEYQYRSMIERITDGFFSLDKDYKYLFLNEKAAEIIRQKPSYVIGRTVWDVFPDLVNSSIYNCFLKAMNEQVYVHTIEYYESFDIWKEIHIYPAAEGLSVFVSDITEKKKNELAARESDEIRNMIMNSALDAIISVDINGRFIFWNKRAEALFGWSFDEIKEQKLTDTIIPQQHRAAHLHSWNKYLTSNETHASGRLMELTSLNKNGQEFPIELFMIPIRTGKTEFFCAFIRDISERKNFERQLIAQQKAAAREITATALDAQEKERNIIGQELHDNINQILVGTRLLLQLTITNPEKNKQLIEKSIDSLGDVIEENRKLAHNMVTPNTENESIAGLLKMLTENMFFIMAPQLQVKLESQEDLALTNNQKLTLYRIAQEQCTNIIKHANATKVAIRLSEKNGCACMTIEDNGQGMDAGKKPNGIGLRNINSRLSIYNGSSEIITAAGKGFKLIVYLPL